MRIYERYKLYDKALTKSGLDPKIFPNLKEIWTKVDASKTNNDTKREKRSGGQGRNMYLCIGFSKILWENIYSIIKKFVTPMELPGYICECFIIGS